MRIFPLFLPLSLLLTAAAPARAQTVPADLAFTDICPSCSNFSTPLGIQQADGLPLLFVHEQGGRVAFFNPDTLAIQTLLNFGSGGSTPPGGFVSGGEQGLLGLAFHPQFASNRFMFLSYSDGSGDTMIARYTLGGGATPTVDLGTRQVILRVDQDFSNHNGGHIAFGADGYLYIGLGDGGSANDPCNRAQTLTPGERVLTGSCTVDSSFTNSGGNANSLALLGSILRIDVDGQTPAGSNGLCASNADGSANYAIPADNPFAGNSGVAGACDEILDFGIRNPWRFSFDRLTGDLLIGDVGQNAREEVSLRAFGAISGAINFGWDCREGFIGASGTCRAGSTPVDPILDYARAAGSSITGGFVYRGPIGQMNGVYFFADFNSRRVWTATETAPGVYGPQPTSSNQWTLAPSNVSSFGEDALGNVYVVGYSNGRIYRLTSESAGSEVFRDGFE